MTTGVEYRTRLCQRFSDALSGREEKAAEPHSPPHGEVLGYVKDPRALALHTLADNFRTEAEALQGLIREAHCFAPCKVHDLLQRRMLAAEMAAQAEGTLWVLVRAEFPEIGQFCVHRVEGALAVCGQLAPEPIQKLARVPFVPFWRN